MTKEQEKRIIQAAAETQRKLDREMAYLPKFRKQETIARYEAHLEKLAEMLTSGETPVCWIA